MLRSAAREFGFGLEKCRFLGLMRAFAGGKVVYRYAEPSGQHVGRTKRKAAKAGLQLAYEALREFVARELFLGKATCNTKRPQPPGGFGL